MKKFKKCFNLVAVFLIILISSVSVLAQQKQVGFQSLTSGLGLSPSWWGISAIADVTPNVSIQVILNPLGDLNKMLYTGAYAGRGIYRFIKKTYWNAYGYGMLGAWSYLTDSLNLKEKTGIEIMDIIFGPGAGIEYNWKALYSKLPSIAWNLEVGLGMVNFKGIDIITGAGAHYRF